MFLFLRLCKLVLISVIRPGQSISTLRTSFCFQCPLSVSDRSLSRLCPQISVYNVVHTFGGAVWSFGLRMYLSLNCCVLAGWDCISLQKRLVSFWDAIRFKVKPSTEFLGGINMSPVSIYALC